MIQKHFTTLCLALALVFLGTAALLYPGGSQASLQSSGFDIANNYLCNLFDAKGMNGAENRGMMWAFIGMFFMCVGFGAFFYRISAKIQNRSGALIIRYAGMAGMFFAFWVITPYHDLMVTIGATFAFIAIGYLSIFVFISRLHPAFKILNFCSLVVLYINAVIYYSGMGLALLPIAQKLNYILLIIWVISLEYFTSPKDFVFKKKSGKV